MPKDTQHSSSHAASHLSNRRAHNKQITVQEHIEKLEKRHAVTLQAAITQMSMFIRDLADINGLILPPHPSSETSS
jgi:hypothetical protein